MRLVSWDDGLSVGNDHLDNQRIEIIYLMNMLLKHQSDPASALSHELSVLLTRLRTIVAKHFVEEEILLEQNNCPWLEEHAVDHAYMVLKFSETNAMAKEEIIHQRIPLLYGMLTTHFATQDVECRDYLTANDQSFLTALEVPGQNLRQQPAE